MRFDCSDGQDFIVIPLTPGITSYLCLCNVSDTVNSVCKVCPIRYGEIELDAHLVGYSSVDKQIDFILLFAFLRGFHVVGYLAIRFSNWIKRIIAETLTSLYGTLFLHP